MMFAYQSMEVGRAKMEFGFQTCLKGLFCWLVDNHALYSLKIKMPKLTFWAVEACCIICIIVLLERKVKGRPQERKGRTIGKLRELASYLLLISLPLFGCWFML